MSMRKQVTNNASNEMVSLVVLTYNRPHYLERLLEQLSTIKYQPFEVIVVDNHSDISVNTIVDQFKFTSLIRTESNLGIGGRNCGLKVAKGNIIITLDDDVIGVTDTDIEKLLKIFENPSIGAVCFKVVDEETLEVVNWCHHYKVEEYVNQQFLTNEITEGAVAFRRVAIEVSGYYPERFFISHEGPDMVFRLMNNGYDVIYTPDITVKHAHAIQGRQDWRRYYYDTRNLIWLVLRNYTFIEGVKFLFIGLGSMFVYALRDGLLKYWFKGVWDAIKAGADIWKERIPMSPRTIKINRHINSFRPSFWYMVRKRLFSKKIRI